MIETFCLFQTESEIIIIPNNEINDLNSTRNSTTKAMIIDKSTSLITYQPFENYNQILNFQNQILIHGVAGIFTINRGDILVVISSRTLHSHLPDSALTRHIKSNPSGLGNFDKSRNNVNSDNAYPDFPDEKQEEYHKLYSPTYKLIPITPNPRIPLSQTQRRDDEKYCNLFNLFLSIGNGGIVSWTVDLTRLYKIKTNHGNIDSADDRFIWNYHLLQPFLVSLDPEKCKYLLIVIQGFHSSFTINPNRTITSPIIPNPPSILPLSDTKFTYTFTIFSKRSRAMGGTRYHCRGLDSKGNAANFVETQTILSSPRDSQTRHILTQIRASIPLFWGQVVGLSYKPYMIIEPRIDTTLVFKQHFKTLLHIYGSRMMIVSLVNKGGYEGGLGSEFSRFVEGYNDNVRVRMGAGAEGDGDKEEGLLGYIAWDFHKKGGINFLVDGELGKLVDEYGWEIMDHAGECIKRQTGVVRTNCIDCLDRTNVLQSAVAKRVFERQLAHLGVIGNSEGLDAIKGLNEVFRNVWADHADDISRQYSGTVALKTDITRMGTRTVQGMINDFVTSLNRYLWNHYSDGSRQDAFDLGLGAFKVDVYAKTPFKTQLSKKVVGTFCGLGVVAILFLFHLLEIQRAVVMWTLKHYEGDLVSRPQLVPKTTHSLDNRGKGGTWRNQRGGFEGYGRKNV